MHFTVTFLNPANFEIKKSFSGETIEGTVKKGLSLFKYLGIGGMGTRGFGRFEILNLEGGKGGQ
jgi:CRISPR-associated protein Cmr4